MAGQMKVGVSAFAWTSRFTGLHLELLPAVKRMGIEAFEVPMFDPAALPTSQIKKAFEKSGLECTVCAILPRQFNPISPDSKTRRIAIDHLIRCVQASAALGASLLGGPLFAPIGYLPRHRPTDAEWRWAVEAFQALGEVLDAHDITLSIEPVNRSETFFLRNAAEAAQLCDSVGNPRIGITLDTFHANIEELSIPAAIRGLGRRLKHVHASENDRGPLGRGHVPFVEIVAALHEIGYVGYLMIEGFGFAPKEKSAPGHLWADREVSPEYLASNGAQYLARLLTRSNR